MNATVTSKASTTLRKATKRPVSVAEYLTQQIALSGKTNLDIAREAGFAKPNIISMIKKGDTKLPITKVAPMARALGVDPIHLFKLVMQEYQPDTWAALEEDILKQPVVTANEFEIIEVIRKSNVVNPKVRNNEDRKRILDAVATLKPDGS
jgi:hypothetical protein